MKYKNYHLTYCTNVHPGEDWATTFTQLKKYILPLKEKLAPETPFGIGLRLSAKAAAGLLENNGLDKFQKWLLPFFMRILILIGFNYFKTYH
ncbi:hypothetical protein V5739_04760 [Salinimicrobium sp. TIG7-5_MAKvit]|uniref:hypothetical protein n=1 Tax=Salinimicrobium sp. TIG7-5_MAKvit TaxID=3121289 RepID=UPI003C6DDA6C